MNESTAQTARVRVPILAAPASIADMREGMVAEEMLIAQRAGVSLDRPTAERLIASDLALSDAVARETPPAWSVSPDPEREAARSTGDAGAQRQRRPVPPAGFEPALTLV